MSGIYRSLGTESIGAGNHKCKHCQSLVGCTTVAPAKTLLGADFGLTTKTTWLNELPDVLVKVGG